MPRAALSKVSLKQLVGELKKRQARLKSLMAERDALNEEIGELQGLDSNVPTAAPAKPGRKPAKGKRGSYGQTAEQLILSLLKGKGATSKQINASWKDAGRKGRADNTLNRLFKAGEVKREKLQGQKGSRYTLA